MVINLTDEYKILAGGSVFSLREHGYVDVHCLESRLWLTQEGLAEDIVLSPGESQRLLANRQVVIEAIGPRPARIVLRRFVNARNLRVRLAAGLRWLAQKLEGQVKSCPSAS